MFINHDMGASLYRTWSSEQKRDEIAKLVEGYRNGLPVGILCGMAEAIAGSREEARGHLLVMMTPEERAFAISQEKGGMKSLAESFLS